MTTSEERKSSRHSALARSPVARSVSFGDGTLVVDLEDGRQISVPIAWFPRLAAAMAVHSHELNNWRLIGGGIGIHWPDIDEDVSVENLLGVGSDLLMYRNGHEPQVDDGSGAASRSPEKRAEPRGRNFGGPRDI